VISVSLGPFDGRVTALHPQHRDFYIATPNQDDVFAPPGPCNVYARFWTAYFKSMVSFIVELRYFASLFLSSRPQPDSCCVIPMYKASSSRISEQTTWRSMGNAFWIYFLSFHESPLLRSGARGTQGQN